MVKHTLRERFTREIFPEIQAYSRSKGKEDGFPPYPVVHSLRSLLLPIAPSASAPFSIKVDSAVTQDLATLFRKAGLDFESRDDENGEQTRFLFTPKNLTTERLDVLATLLNEENAKLEGFPSPEARKPAKQTQQAISGFSR